MSRFDQIYRSVLLSKFFTKGWGNPEDIKRLIEFRRVVLDRDKCHSLVPKDYPVVIDKTTADSDCIVMDGHFRSPFADLVAGVVPKESENAYFQVLLPNTWKTKLKPVCLHLAGTGDHHFWRRRTLLAKPLLKEAGIGSIILENPFYGLRKPKDQVRSSLHNVSDIFVMGGCLAFESTVLFHWCERQGFGPLGVTGISMGGHMASIAASVWPRPIALIPCLSWTTASCVFTQGVMSGAVNWNLLENQYFSDCVYREDLKSMICNLQNDKAFEAGQHFIKDYPASMKRVNAMIKEQHAQNMTAAAQQTEVVKQGVDLATGFNQQFVLTNILQRLFTPLSSIGGTSSFTSMSSSADSTASVTFRENSLERLRRKKESHAAAIHFMRGIMDEFTHLASFSKPVDSSLVIIVVAKDDAYVLREGIEDLSEIWSGAEVRYIDAGHIAAFLFKQSVFRKAIVDSFDRLIEKHYRGAI